MHILCKSSRTAANVFAVFDACKTNRTFNKVVVTSTAHFIYAIPLCGSFIDSLLGSRRDLQVVHPKPELACSAPVRLPAIAKNQSVHAQAVA